MHEIPPPYSFKRAVLVGGVFALVAYLLILPLKSPINFYDEGLSVLNAARINDGEVPYRDFWTVYPAGQFYALAALFKLFGPTLLVARLYDTLLRFLILGLVYAISSRLSNSLYASATVLACALLLAAVRFYTYAVFPALLLALVAVALTITWRARLTLARGAIVGAVMGCVFLFRWDVGLYTLFSLGGATLLWHLHARLHREQDADSVRLPSLYALGIGFLVAVGVAMVVYGYWSAQAGLGVFWDQVLTFPLTTLRETRWKPYPSLLPFSSLPSISRAGLNDVLGSLANWAPFYAPLLVYSFSGFLFVLRPFVKKHPSSDCSFSVTVLGLLGASTFLHALSRYDPVHLLPTSLFCLVLLFYLLRAAFTKIDSLPVKVVVGVLVLATIAVYVRVPLQYLRFTQERFPVSDCYSSLERAGCVYVNPNQEQAIQHVQRVTPEGTPIFVGTQRHDRVFANDISFYFLANRPSATSYHELHPGVATTRPVQNEIVEDLKTQDVEWVVLWDAPNPEEPNASSVSSGVHALDDYLRSAFVPEAEYGRYTVARKESIAP